MLSRCAGSCVKSLVCLRAVLCGMVHRIWKASGGQGIVYRRQIKVGLGVRCGEKLAVDLCMTQDFLGCSAVQVFQRRAIHVEKQIQETQVAYDVAAQRCVRVYADVLESNGLRI